MAKRNLKLFPTLITYIDPHGREFAPPDPPLREGHPPWVPLPNEYPRDVPLPRCPDVKCRRARACLSPHYGKFCQRTHMLADEFRGLLATKIEQLTEQFKDSCTPPASGDGMKEFKQALEAREKELLHQALLEWQTNWVKEQKALAKPAGF